jgi:hypothetical protein
MILGDCERALDPLRSMLAADGYLLHLESRSGSANELSITVKAGPDACEECLVPVELFTDIVTRHLADNGLRPSVTIVYPDQPRESSYPSDSQEWNAVKETER